MSAQRQRRRRATSPSPRARVKRDGHRTGNGAAHPSEQSAAADDNKDTGQHALELAALAYARELPSVVARAIRRAARGKPTPLLRSLTRILRETGALLDTNAEKKARTPKPHPQLGLLTPFEFEILAGNLAFLRESQSNAEYLEDLQAKQRGQAMPHTPDADTLEQTPDELPHAASAEEVAAAEAAAAAQQQPYTGPERRVRHIPSHVFLGTQERRRRRP